MNGNGMSIPFQEYCNKNILNGTGIFPQCGVKTHQLYIASNNVKPGKKARKKLHVFMTSTSSNATAIARQSRRSGFSIFLEAACLLVVVKIWLACNACNFIVDFCTHINDVLRRLYRVRRIKELRCFFQIFLK